MSILRTTYNSIIGVHILAMLDLGTSTLTRRNRGDGDTSNLTILNKYPIGLNVHVKWVRLWWFINFRCANCSLNSSHIRLSIHQNSVAHTISSEANHLMWHSSTIGNQGIIVFFNCNALPNSNNIKVIRKVPQKGDEVVGLILLWEDFFIKSSLACHTLTHVLKVGWNFWDLLFPLLKLWKNF